MGLCDSLILKIWWKYLGRICSDSMAGWCSSAVNNNTNKIWRPCGTKCLYPVLWAQKPLLHQGHDQLLLMSVFLIATARKELVSLCHGLFVIELTLSRLSLLWLLFTQATTCIENRGGAAVSGQWTWEENSGCREVTIKRAQYWGQEGMFPMADVLQFFIVLCYSSNEA